MRTALVFLGLALGGALVFGRCPCEGGHASPCPGNGSNYLQAFIDNSCPFPPNLLKVEWNGIFGSQSTWVPSVSPGHWRTNVFGVTWEAQRVTDSSDAGHWMVSWTVGSSAVQSTSLGSPTNCQASVSWSDSHGTWSVMPCEWVQPTGQSLASTNYVKTIEFVGIVDPCGSPILIGGHVANEQQFEYGQSTTVRHGTAGCPMSIRVYCPDAAGDRISVILDGDIPATCFSTNPCPDGRFLAWYTSPVVLTNAGTSVAGIIVSNHMYGTTGCDADWWAKGGYAVIRLRPR